MTACTLTVTWDGTGPETVPGVEIPENPTDEQIEKIYKALEVLYGAKPRYFTWKREK